jgi:DNA ligase-associated metallophosphoesterase
VFPTSSIKLNGAALLADISGALAWPEAATVVVADLHLEKASSFAARGQMLPPYDTRATLERLDAVLGRFPSERVICLGDSFHDNAGPERLDGADVERLRLLAARREWIWLAGNHDKAPVMHCGGRSVAGELTLGPLVFRHAAGRDACGEISGHFHPKARIATRGGHVTGRCFVADSRRIVLPAFGAYAGGLDAADPAIASLFPDGGQLHVIGRNRIATFPLLAATSHA